MGGILPGVTVYPTYFICKFDEANFVSIKIANRQTVWSASGSHLSWVFCHITCEEYSKKVPTYHQTIEFQESIPSLSPSISETFATLVISAISKQCLGLTRQTATPERVKITQVYHVCIKEG